jgi:hypothetical protein
MSCDFCNTYDFTSIAVRENNIHMAGGSSRFTDPDVNRGRYELFKYCPICGANLYYYDLSVEDAKHKLEQVKPVVVAVDGKGDRIDFAVFDDETTMPEDDYYMISQLRTDAGVGFQLAKEAFRYAKSHYGDYDMMIAYIKAKVMAVNTGNMPFDKRVEHFMKG